MSAEEPPVVAHEIGNRTYLVADVEPLDLDGVRTMQVGTGLWVVAAVVLFFLRDTLEARDAGWWLWVAVAGSGLGLVGLDHCRRMRRRRVHAEADPA